ncbi:dehydrogenase/reductase SDR family member 11-like [Paramacrobiotus metropolitanus]|uniref:dehydrogenase/reductase SDR family member 11-like n=1 Tax=Paramacrobiotus metropolitanus TaxID=2943436 RepID=UPI00244594A5|nr:dehydrogenase/reductase SDR family member 11-like [Paramacrobiotus metropolitanus]
MDRWRGKTALITGASSGIGLATAERLARSGMTVIGCARNIAPIEELQQRTLGTGVVHAIRCDVTQEAEIVAMFREIEGVHGGVDVLVNNAGLAHSDDLLTRSVGQWRQMVDTNILGLSTCAREAVRLMVKHGIRGGHIINMNSVSGHKINDYNAIHFYAATKHMVTALTEGLRREVAALGTSIRVTVRSLSPGATLTDFANRWLGEAAVRDTPYVKEGFTFLESGDIADAIVYVLSEPAHVTVQEMILVPTEQKSG